MKKQQVGGGRRWMRWVPEATVVAVLLATTGAGAARAGSAGSTGTVIPHSTSGHAVALAGTVGPMVADGAGHVFVSNATRNEVDVLDVAAATLETPIPVGSAPRGLDLSADGTALYVANAGARDVSVVDVATRHETHRIAIPAIPNVDEHPFSIAIASNGTALVSMTTSSPGFGKGRTVNLTTEAVTARNDGPSGPWELQASRDRSRIAAVDLGTSSGPVGIYRVATNTFTTGVEAGHSGQFVAPDPTGQRLLVGPGTDVFDAALFRRGTIPGGGDGVVVDPSGLRAYRVQDTSVEVIDLSRQLVTATIALPESLGIASGRVVITPDGSTLIVATQHGLSTVAVSDAIPVPACSGSVTGDSSATYVAHVCGGVLAAVVTDGAGHAFATNPGRNEVEVLDLATGVLEAPIPVGSQPRGLDLTPDGSTLYVADSGASELSVVDVGTRRETHRITVPSDPFYDDLPVWVVTEANGKALLSTTAHLLELDLAHETLTARPDLPAARISRSGDHTRVAFVNVGGVGLFDSATGTFASSDLVRDRFTVALDQGGTRLVTGTVNDLLDAALVLRGTLAGFGRGVVFGDGSTLYRAADRVEVVDLDRQQVTATIPLPEPVASDGGLALSGDRTRLVAITDSGLTVVPVAAATPVPPCTSTVSTAAPGAIAHVCGAPLSRIVVDGAGHAFATSPGRNEVEVLDLSTGTLEAPIAVGSHPVGLDLTPDGRTLYVADNGAQEVSVVDVATRRETHRITVPSNFSPTAPSSIAVTNDGRAFIRADSSVLRELDLTTEVIRPAGDLPEIGTELVSSGDHSRIVGINAGLSAMRFFVYDVAANHAATGETDHGDFVAVDRTGDRALINPETTVIGADAVVRATIAGPRGGQGVAISADGRTGYRVENTTVDVLDLTRNLAVATIQLPEAVGSASGTAALSPDGTTLAVLTATGISSIPVSAAVPLPDCPSTLTGDLAAGLIAHVCGATIDDVVADGAGHVFASNPSRNEIEVLDVDTGTLEPPIPVAAYPRGIDLSADGSTLYVAAAGAGQVSVVDVAKRVEVDRISMPDARRPISIAVARNGKALVTVGSYYAGGGLSLIALDLNARTATVRSDLPDAFSVGRVAASADRSRILIPTTSIHGTVYVYDSATDSIGPGRDVTGFALSGALDRTGSRAVVVPDGSVLDRNLSPVGSIGSGGKAVAVSPSGTVIYRSQSEWVDVVGIAGPRAPQTSIGLPEPLGDTSGSLSISPSGDVLAVVTASGFSTLGVPVAQAKPTLTATATASIRLGQSATATATLAGAPYPGGSITFAAFGPGDPTCGTEPVFTSTSPVGATGTFTSAPFTPAAGGLYRWTANYSGDAFNAAAGPTACGDPAATTTVTSAHLSLHRSASASAGPFPLTVTYTYTVVNDGADGITGVVVSDTQCGPVSFVSGPGGPAGTLAPGATWTYKCQRTFIGPGSYAGTATAIGTDVIDHRPVGPATAEGTATVHCDHTVTGSTKGSLTLAPGATCLNGATVNGDLVVPIGSALYLSGGSVRGSIVAQGASSVTICGTQVGSHAVVVDSRGPVVIGSERDEACLPNVVKGVLAAANNRAGFEAVGNWVGAGLLVVGTQGTGPRSSDGQAEIEGNYVRGPLACSSNVPPPINGGFRNVVTGPRSGQCSAAAF